MEYRSTEDIFTACLINLFLHLMEDLHVLIVTSIKNVRTCDV